jgi:hypothetical protein
LVRAVAGLNTYLSVLAAVRLGAILVVMLAALVQDG